MHLLPDAPVRTAVQYLELRDGGVGLATAQELGAHGTIACVEAAGLRGRGGGGFPTATKWRSVAGQPPPRHLVVNGAEGEPGTFKDRAILRADPFEVVEGALIAALAIDATSVYIAVKASFREERDGLVRAISQLQQAGLCQDCPVAVVEGPDDYLFGEESALLEVIEGRPPLPRLLPPYQHGLFASEVRTGWEGSAAPSPGRSSSHPTVVNNVETIAHVPHILREGPRWFRREGSPTTPGTTVCTVVGDVVRPGFAEVPLGMPLGEVIDRVGGGPHPGRRVKAVASGVSNPVMTAATLSTPIGFDELRAAGGGLGSAGFIVFDDTACMLRAAAQMSAFLARASCGQCLSCLRGTGEITARLRRLDDGDALPHDVEETWTWLDRVTDSTRCYLATEEQVLVASILDRFADEVAEHRSGHGCSRPRDVAGSLMSELGPVA